MSGNVIPSTGVSQGSSLIVRLYDAAKAVKVHKTRLSELIRQCDLLLSTVREYSPRFIGTEVGTEADGIERAIEGILVRVLGWARLGDAATFVKQNEIQKGIEECHRELTTCTDRFMVALNMVKNSESQVREMARRRDHQQLFDMMAVLLEEVRKRAQLMTSEASQPREQLLQTQVLEVDGQGGVPKVASSPRSKPADHSGKVSKVSEDPVIEGSQLLFYIGEYNSDGERTTLSRLRGRSPDSQKRFKEWIEATLGLQHRNILNFIGHVTIDDIVYSVNPMMENGNIREYIQRCPDADRVRLLSEVASGMEFLHESEIVHGDLCDKNILINRDGKAIVCGFDLFDLSDPAVIRARWLAPERITSANVTSPTENTDIWSFGLLCLEVFTGKDPYSSYSDLYVPVLLTQGTHPEYPGDAAIGLSPKMWDLMRSCWEIDPTKRPSMSRIQLTIREVLPPRDSRRPSIGSTELPVLTLITPTDGTAPPNEPGHTSAGMLYPLSPLRTPMLFDIPPVTQETSAFLRTVDRQPDPLTPIRRTVSDSPSFGSRPLPPLPEDSPDIPAQPLSAPPQLTAPGVHKQSRRPFTAPNPSASSSALRRQPSAESSSSQSTSSTSESNKWRLFSIGHKRSQTTPNTSPEPPSTPSVISLPQGAPPANSSSLNRSTTAPANTLLPNRSETSPTSPPASIRSKTAAASPPAPNKSKTTPTKKTSKMMPPQPSRSATMYIALPQSRKWEPVSPVVLDFMERAASDSECILRPAKDGTVSAGNLEGLVSRVISDTADPFRSDRFRATFLTIYQLFSTSEQLFSILKRRFKSAELDPATLRSRFSILLFIESWLKKGFEDEKLKCSSMIKEFILAIVGSETISETMESKAKEIASLIDDPDYVCLRQPKSCTPLRRDPTERPHGVTPADLAAALTAVEGDRFRCITYWDYVNFTRRRSKVRRIEVFNIVHDLVTVWVQTTILEPNFLDERTNMYEEWIYTAEECRRLNNFSSTSAIVIALMSPMIKALTLTCESKAKPMLYSLAQDLTPADGMYHNTLGKVATRDVIPWLDRHLSTLNSSFAHSNPIVEVDGHPLIDFKQCGEIAEQIESLVQYSPPRTHNAIRTDVLAYVESGLKSSNGDDAVRAAEERSAYLAGEERSLLEHRDKMRRLGLAWLPHQRK